MTRTISSGFFRSRLSLLVTSVLCPRTMETTIQRPGYYVQSNDVLLPPSPRRPFRIALHMSISYNINRSRKIFKMESVAYARKAVENLAIHHLYPFIGLKDLARLIIGYNNFEYELFEEHLIRTQWKISDEKKQRYPQLNELYSFLFEKLPQDGVVKQYTSNFKATFDGLIGTRSLLSWFRDCMCPSQDRWCNRLLCFYRRVNQPGPGFEQRCICDMPVMRK